MPTPKLSDEMAREAFEAWQANDCRMDLGAKALGINAKTFYHRLNVARARGMHLSEGARHSVTTACLAPMEARGGYRRVYNEDGKQIDTVRWLAPKDDQADDNLIDRMVEAFSAIPELPAMPAPERVQEDLCILWPLYDVHWGEHAWGQETGGPDYDLKLAESDLRKAFERVLAMVPFAGHAVLLIGGDFFHTDDSRNETPENGHRLDADGRFYKIIDTAIETLIFIIQRIASKASKVTVRVLRGNHDKHSHRFLTVGLGQRFRAWDIVVDKTERDLFTFQWGKTAIFAHHGDKMKPQDMVLRLADQCPFWSDTRHRYAYTGHRHKFASERIGGVLWEQLDAFCPPDAYGSTWTSRRAFKAEVFSRTAGRVLTAHDPLERD